MRFLPDTQALLWWLTDDPRLGAETRRAVATGAPVVSPAALWEVAIKAALGTLKADVGEIAQAVAAQGMARLPIADAHLVRLQSLPPLHRDPFDRLLIAQAHVETLALMTADVAIARYGVETVAANR